jgi:hypothetical protein
VESNGAVSNGNGTEVIYGAPNSKSSAKRTASEAVQDGSPLPKRPKTISNTKNGSTVDVNPILVEDSANGAILIDDD